MIHVTEVSLLPLEHAQNAARCLAFWEALDVPVQEIPEWHRDYVDWLSHRDLERPVIKGRDVRGRRFAAFKLYCGYGDEDPDEVVAVMHERYTGRDDIWVLAGGGGWTDEALGFPMPDVRGLERLLAGEVSGGEGDLICKVRLVS